MTECWKNHFDLFVWGSLLIGIFVALLAWLLQKKNNLAKAGESTRRFVLCTLRDTMKKIYRFLKKKYEALTENPSQNSEQKNKSPEPKNLLWFVEIAPFILACLASIILFNWLFVIAEKNHFSIPSPLSYENTFLLVLPLAWTVGIAFFQYRIQDRLTLSQKKESEIQKKQEKLQQQEQRRSEMVSALRSLYSCNFSAINFNTRAVTSSTKKAFSLSIHNNSFDSGFAFEIINKSGDPCFYFPYYKCNCPNDFSSCISLKIGGNPIEKNWYSITPNEAYIFIPSNIQTSLANAESEDANIFEEKVHDFFVGPSLGGFSQQNGLECEIVVDMQESFGIDIYSEAQFATNSSPIQYKICFTLRPCGGYSSEGRFPLKITNHSISPL